MTEIKPQEVEREEYQGGLRGGIEVDEAIEAPEPWESWETKLVGYSLAIGLAALAIGGLLVNKFLLS